MSILLSILLWLPVLAGSADDCPAPPDQALTDVYIVQHAWHAGITVPTEHFSVDDYPVLEHFEEFDYLEVGWGDAGYFPHPSPGVVTTIRAGLWPTSSTIHVMASNFTPDQLFPQTEVLRFPISRHSLDQLLRYFREAHVYDNDSVTPTEEGLYGRSFFFDGHELYHVFNNSNHWAARALEAAGCPVEPRDALTIEQLFAQIREFVAEAY